MFFSNSHLFFHLILVDLSNWIILCGFRLILDPCLIKNKQFIINELEESSKDVDFGSFKTETIYSGTIGGQSTCFVFYKDSSQEEQFMSIIYKMCPSKIKEK